MIGLWIAIRTWWTTLRAKTGAKKFNAVAFDEVLRQAGLPNAARINELALYNATKADKEASDARAAQYRKLVADLGALYEAMENKVETGTALNLVKDSAKKAGIRDVPARKPTIIRKPRTKKTVTSDEQPS